MLLLRVLEQGSIWVTHVKRGGLDTDILFQRFMDKEEMVLTATIVPRKIKRRGDMSVQDVAMCPPLIRRCASRGPVGKMHPRPWTRPHAGRPLLKGNWFPAPSVAGWFPGSSG